MLVYTTTVDSVLRMLWLATQTLDIQCCSLIHLQLLRASDAKLTLVMSKMVSQFAAVTNKEISQIFEQAVPEIHKEGDEIRFGGFNR